VLDVDRGVVEQVKLLLDGRERSVTVVPFGSDALVLSYLVCSGCRPSADMYLLRRGSTVATRIGRALDAIPSLDGRAVWTLSNRPARRCVIRLLGADGHPLRAGRPAPCRYDLIAELPAGLLFSFVGAQGRNAHTALLERSGRIVRLGRSDVQPVAGDLVLSGAGRHAPLVLEDVGTAVRRALRWPNGAAYSLGTVTGRPSGRFAVVEFARFSPTHRSDLWLLDAVLGRWRHLPNMPARLVPKVTDVNWTTDGRIVVLSGRTLGVWRPGDARMTFRRVPAPREPGSEFVIW
jgi:hypothetical protein